MIDVDDYGGKELWAWTGCQMPQNLPMPERLQT